MGYQVLLYREGLRRIDMKTATKITGWEIKPCKNPMEPGKIDLKHMEEDNSEEWVFIDDAAEVQEALIQKGLLSDSLLEDGDSGYCNWISDTDWIYRCRFDGNAEDDDKTYIHFKGIDTVGDVFLNGKYMGQSRSMYLNFVFEAAGLKKQDNVLLVYIHSNKKMHKIYEDSMPDHWRGNVTTLMMLRKGRDAGSSTDYHPIGLYDDVILERVDRTQLTNMDITTDFDVDLTYAAVQLTAEGSSFDGDIEVKFTVEEEDGKNPVYAAINAEKTPEGWRAAAKLHIDQPRLWWPKNYGDQPMYRISCEVFVNGEKCDQTVKMTGLRHVRLIGSMRFEVNGVEVRWWGTDIAPIYGLTNRYIPEKALAIIEKIDECNMNALRIWGPGKPYPDEFYYEFDKRGIMVWQDFPTGTWQMPDSEEYKKIYGDEAIFMIKRLKAHPCIMLWCGGNEHIYMCELYDWKGRIGFDMLLYGYRRICNQYDPQRYYHVSSPYEGRYTNDPSYGDSHGSRAFFAYIPGEDYGTFLSEDIRVFPSQYKSTVRFMRDEIWDESYIDQKTYGTKYPMPEGWKKRLGNNGYWMLGKTDHFYSARNPYELIYKFAMAAAQDIYEILAKSRTGNMAVLSKQGRRSSGHLFWKFNDTWPGFYTCFYDFYGECTLPYYFLKKVYAPFMTHIEVGDHIYVWGVNDTRKDRLGYLTVRIFNIPKNRITKEMKITAAVPAGESVVITDLDKLGAVKWESVLYAEFTDCEGNILSKSHSYVTQENMLEFPEAELSLEYEEGYLTLRTDKFARCVELTGKEDGDEFGWYFEDNYFDLLPFETKKVKVSGRHRAGTVSAKAHYSDKISSIEIRDFQ
jgi:hypothetical protein